MTNHGQPKTQLELWAAIEREGPPACEQIPDIYFPEDFPDRHMRHKAIEMAKALCNECSIKLECLAAAMMNHEAYGIWGGTTPQERGYIGR